ncbi:hypothetical protein NBRC116495_09760 [Aurantivibrio plasticivorans]
MTLETCVEEIDKVDDTYIEKKIDCCGDYRYPTVYALSHSQCYFERKARAALHSDNAKQFVIWKSER